MTRLANRPFWGLGVCVAACSWRPLGDRSSPMAVAGKNRSTWAFWLKWEGDTRVLVCGPPTRPILSCWLGVFESLSLIPLAPRSVRRHSCIPGCRSGLPAPSSRHRLFLAFGVGSWFSCRAPARPPVPRFGSLPFQVSSGLVDGLSGLSEGRWGRVLFTTVYSAFRSGVDARSMGLREVDSVSWPSCHP